MYVITPQENYSTLYSKYSVYYTHITKTINTTTENYRLYYTKLQKNYVHMQHMQNKQVAYKADTLMYVAT